MNFPTPTPRVFELIPLTRENIKPNIVLRSPAQDGSVHVFNDTVIEAIEGEIVCLARPYAYLKDGVVHTDCERIRIPIALLVREQTHFYVMEGTRPAQVWGK